MRPESYYQRGVVTVRHGSPIVTGENTLWLTGTPAYARPQAGTIFTVDKAHFYQIISVDSETQLTLEYDYAANDSDNVSYIVLTDAMVDPSSPEGVDMVTLLQRAIEAATAAEASEVSASTDAARAEDAADRSEAAADRSEAAADLAVPAAESATASAAAAEAAAAGIGDVVSEVTVIEQNIVNIEEHITVIEENITIIEQNVIEKSNNANSAANRAEKAAEGVEQVDVLIWIGV